GKSITNNITDSLAEAKNGLNAILTSYEQILQKIDKAKASQEKSSGNSASGGSSGSSTSKPKSSSPSNSSSKSSSPTSVTLARKSYSAPRGGFDRNSVVDRFKMNGYDD